MKRIKIVYLNKAKEKVMDIEQMREYCLSKPHATEGFPFDEDILAFKVADKIFALVSLEKNLFCNLKCDPVRAIDLRAEYSGIRPGWHMSKKHWNSVYFREDVNDSLFLELIDHSYECVVQTFSKKKQKELAL